MGRRKRPIDKEDIYRNNAILRSYASTISSRYPFVKCIRIKYETQTPGDIHEVVFKGNDKAFFKIECQFSECYGYGSGFDLQKYIDSVILNRLSESDDIDIQCGGYGDIGQHYHCDNYLHCKIFVEYIDNK